MTLIHNERIQQSDKSPRGNRKIFLNEANSHDTEFYQFKGEWDKDSITFLSSTFENVKAL